MKHSLKHTTLLIIASSLILGTLSIASAATNGEPNQPKTLPATPPQNKLAEDFPVSPTQTSSSGGVYSQLIKLFVPLMEAEKRATLDLNRWTGLQEFQLGSSTPTTESVLNKILQDTPNAKAVIPYPNEINAKYWRLNPPLLPNSAGISPDKPNDPYDARASLLPLAGDSTSQNAIFPLKETITLTDPGSNETIIVPTLTETFKRMLRIRPETACDLNSNPCVTNAYTGVQADQNFQRVNGQWWYEVVESCADKGGRLPRADEAWFFLSSRLWALGNTSTLNTIATQNGGYYTVLTSDVLDVETDHKSLEGFPAFNLKSLDILGIRVYQTSQRPDSGFSLNGFNYAINWADMVQLQQQPYPTSPGNSEFKNAVYYCIYE